MQTIFTHQDAVEDVLDVDTFDHLEGVMFTTVAARTSAITSVVVGIEPLRELVRVLSIELDVHDA